MKPNKFWHKILWLYPCAALYNWKHELKYLPDFNTFRKCFLLPADNVASSVICPDKEKCPHHCDRTIMRDGGMPEGACLEMLKPDLELTTEDIASCQLDTSAFHKAIASALNIEYYNEDCGNSYTWRIGSLAVKPGKRRNVFLTYRREDALFRELPLLNMEEKEPFTLLTFYHYDLPASSKRLLSKYRIECFSLDETLEFKPDCRMALLPSCRNIWSEIIETIAVEQKNQYRFDLPPGTDWEDISIHFQDREKASVTIGGREKVDLLYSQMGMSDKRSAKPTAHWQWLHIFAANDGSYPCEALGMNEKIRQQKRRLSQHLRCIFGLKSDPISWDEELKAYVCRFKIRPDTESTIYHAKLRKEIKSAAENKF